MIRSRRTLAVAPAPFVALSPASAWLALTWVALSLVALGSLTGCSSAENATKRPVSPSVRTTGTSAPGPSASTKSTPTVSPSTSPTSATTPATPSTTPSRTPSSIRVGGKGYSLNKPADWENITATIRATNPKVDLALGAPPQGPGFRTNFNVVVTPTPGNFTQAQLRVEAARELSSLTHTRVEALPSSSLAGTALIGQTSEFVKGGVRVRFVQYLGIRKGYAYALTMTFAPTNAAQAKPTLAAIVSSWQWV